MKTKERPTLEQLELMTRAKMAPPTPKQISNQIKGLFTRHSNILEDAKKLKESLEELEKVIKSLGWEETKNPQDCS